MYSRNFFLLFLINLFFLIGCESDSKTHYKNAVNQHMSKIDQNKVDKISDEPIDSIIYDQDALIDRASQKIKELIDKNK